MTAIVHGLESEYGSRIKVQIEDATKPANATRIREEFGFRTHGMVIYGKAGAVEQKLDGHELKEPQIRQALETVLGGSPAGES